jgi:uncharacterized protein YndB with AHSA1/START domain
MPPTSGREPPIATTGMLIRAPVGEVFKAFVDPDVTTRFWFTKSSGWLEAGSQVEWEWEMYGMSIPVDVRAVEPNVRIEVEWPGENAPTTVEWTFLPHRDVTYVTITNRGFSGEPEDITRQVADATEGFALVLAGAKALLEHGIQLNLVGDRFPDGIGSG